ncbi:hypothetical protein CAEBREN_21301 [Caenorhabditis brenneri]|uniref:Uncharacterized protein n=1 Tax=Caenorhabditis brenneri TaxID=135651 RepID=G0NDF6_CAEBE|nr:hypothetical protein CAEBREN_21301 [Caenorhabditis brenneri]
MTVEKIEAETPNVRKTKAQTTPAHPVDMFLYQKAVAHVRNTSVCHDYRLQLYNDSQQKLFFDQRSDGVPQFVRRDHPTGRWLFENHVRKEEKWTALTHEEKQE